MLFQETFLGAKLEFLFISGLLRGLGRKAGGGGGAWYPSQKGTGTLVVDLVPGSILERVEYANMEDWRMDCLWWLVLTVNPVKRSASLFINVP